MSGDLNMLYVSPGMLAKIDRLMALRSTADDERGSATRAARELIVEIKPVLEALHDLICCDRDMWHMNATHFNCSEAEAVAGLLRALGGDEDADVFMEAHAEGDMEGDEHYRVEGMEEPHACDSCSEIYDEAGGDGYFGLCPSCADKSEPEEDSNDD